jgi:hypothetical protein
LESPVANANGEERAQRKLERPEPSSQDQAKARNAVKDFASDTAFLKSRFDEHVSETRELRQQLQELQKRLEDAQKHLAQIHREIAEDRKEREHLKFELERSRSTERESAQPDPKVSEVNHKPAALEETRQELNSGGLGGLSSGKGLHATCGGRGPRESTNENLQGAPTSGEIGGVIIQDRPLPSPKQSIGNSIVGNGTCSPASVDQFKETLFTFLQKACGNASQPPFVLMFSGTIYIQEKRANRPIRLTRSLIARQNPVLFSYFRWDTKEAIPDNYSPLLFQSPIDKTLEFMRQISRFDFGPRPKIFVLSFPYPAACRYLNELNAAGWVTLYDVRDDWEEFQKVDMAKWYDQSVEIYAVNNCDYVTTVSAPLQAKMQRISGRNDIHLSPNAYDKEFLKEGVVGEPSAKSNKIVIGYFGHLTASWFDWEFVTNVAQTKPDWRIEIIGHGQPKDLKLPENVRYLGFLDHKEICRVARGWHCGIIPFKISKLADGVDPIKIYEYLSLGLPTVSLTMPQIANYPYTTLARNVEEFIQGVQRSIAIKVDPERIRTWLEANTWEKRVEHILRLCNIEQPHRRPLKLLQA